MKKTISSSASPTSNKRIAKNTLVLYFRMIISMTISLYTSRVILNTLGVEDFGIYNVTGGVVLMFGFFNGAMTSATQRFLSYEIGKNNFVGLKKVFNATQIIHIGIAVIIFVLAETLGFWFVKTYLVIPVERLTAAIWVYHFSVLAFIISILQVPYDALIIAHERMKVYAYVSIIEVILKLIIVFILTWIAFDKLKLYGILVFCVILFITCIYIIYTRKNFKESKFEVVKDDKLYKTLIKYSSWSLFGNLAFVAKGQGINIILNIFFGPMVNAAQAIANQVQATVQGFVTNFQLAVNPQIVKSYASEEKDYLTTLLFRSAKLSFFLMYLLSLPIILEIEQILRLWLKIVPEQAFIFTILTLVVILITCITGPLTASIQATGKIAVYQSVGGTLQMLILPISYILLKYFLNPIIPLCVTIFIETIALFICVFFSSKSVGFSVRHFLKEIIFKNFLIVILTYPFLLLIRNMIDESFVRLMIIGILSIVWTVPIIYISGLTKNEKLFVGNIIKKIKK
ncbi:oligosaccharide flippase family protein [Chryseobacterium luquanense]|uniref:Oligosaccharide flippase family protein n=1 Tax=Chryseobacterium luquanense TaxID=2983766 RepID=A0ABT3Y090_9FLAO|nr:oligosaccharide flippase family protein [Chryseobacterium luquanense]MCX8531516.1 oligosaccharide flippase family protein [Chryseobacterium luquanense]